jgi:hypothetical protein
MRIELVALVLLGTGLGLACGTAPEPSREPLGATTEGPDGSAAAPDAGSAAAPDAGSPAEIPTSGFPCDVHAVLEAYCARCHTVQTYTTAYPYRTPDVWRQTIVAGESLGQYAVARMQASTSPMPPANDTGPRPTAADIDVVARWVAAGMPDGTCGPLTSP